MSNGLRDSLVRRMPWLAVATASASLLSTLITATTGTVVGVIITVVAPSRPIAIIVTVSISALVAVAATSVSPLVAPALSVAFGSSRSPASTSHTAPWRAPHATAAAHRATHVHVVGLGSGLLDVHLLAGDGLLWRLEQFVHHLFGVEGDETEALALVLLLVEWHLDFDDVAKLSEEGLDLLIADLGGQSTDEDLAVAGLGLLGVDLLVVDNMVAGGHDLVDRIGALVHDEGESSRAARVGVCLDVYALDLTVLAEVFLQFLV